MNKLLEQWLYDLDHNDRIDADRRAASVRGAQRLLDCSSEEIEWLFDALLKRSLTPLGQNAEPLLDALLSHFARWCQNPNRRAQNDLPDNRLRDRIVRLYRQLGPNSKCRHHLLCALLRHGRPEDLVVFAETLVTDPPAQDTAVVQVFTPLFQHKPLAALSLFPRLWDGLAHLRLAAPILDLANYLTREQLVDRHPAAERSGQIASLLGDVVDRLACLEERFAVSGDSTQQAAEMVSEAVTLAISLCDALALIGDRTVVGTLCRALDLRHRRLRTEAAAALARLGEKRGEAALSQMAAEPVVRLRVLAYADELGMLDQIDEQYQTPVARAEAELALYLAQPTNYGLPPTRSELVDQRTQYWPSFDEPVDCFLFRYSFQLGGRQYSNVGIVGPLTHSFTADLADLSPPDIYAAFAGWQVEHEEIYEIDADQFTQGHLADANRLCRRIQDAGYEAVRPLILGFFFNERVLVAEATRDTTPGLVVADNGEQHWYPRGTGPRPLGPAEVYSIYKGRKLLRTFNP